MACQQLITHVEASAQFLAKMPSSMRADAVAGQFNAVKLMLSRIQGPVEALQASNAINAGWGAFLNAYQKGEINAVINRQAAALGPATGHRKQDWGGDFWQVLPRSWATGLPTKTKCQLLYAGAFQISRRKWAEAPK